MGASPAMPDVERERAAQDLRNSAEALRASQAALEFTLESAQVGDWDLDLTTDTARRSPRHDRCFGYAEPVAAWGFETFVRHVHPEDRARVKEDFRAAADGLKDWHIECRVIWPDGTVHWIGAHGSIYRTEKGKATRMLGIVADITARKRAEALLAAQKRALELTLENAPLAQVMTMLVRTVEAQSQSGMLGSILLLDPDGIHLRHGAAPGLPETYNAAIDGIVIGPNAGSCGNAAHTRKPAYVADIATDPLWIDFRDLALSHGLRACWSTPILSGEGEVLGTFAMYYRHAHRPNATDLELVDVATRTASLVIERKRAEEALRRRSDQFETLLNDAPLGVYLIDADFRIRQVNPTALPAFGDIPDLIGRDFEAVIHMLWPNADEIVGRFRHTLQTGEPCVVPEYIEERRDRGAIEYYEWQISRIPLPEGRHGVVCYFRDISERKRHEEHQRMLLNELNHRVKNTLATVQSMARQTLRGSQDTEQARREFDARLMALSKAHDVLTRESWEGALLGDVIEEAVAPYCGEARERFDIEGPNVWVSPKYALALAMALHELCTNAVKHGALSNEAGRVRIAWAVAGRDGARELRMRWTETGGPRVAPPERRGFGSRLIERGLSQDLGGEVRIDFAPAGVVCTIEAPLESGGQPHSSDSILFP